MGVREAAVWAGTSDGDRDGPGMTGGGLALEAQATARRPIRTDVTNAANDVRIPVSFRSCLTLEPGAIAVTEHVRRGPPVAGQGGVMTRSRDRARRRS